METEIAPVGEITFGKGQGNGRDGGVGTGNPADGR